MTNSYNIYEKKLKENINILINKNKLSEAKELIDQYTNIREVDAEIYSMKAVIAILENNIKLAESILLEGLKKYGESFDLLYNLGYIYQVNAQVDLAIEVYKKALLKTNDKTHIDMICDILNSLDCCQDKESILEESKSRDYYEKAVRLDSEGNKSDAALYYGLAYRYSKDEVFKNNLQVLYYDNKALKDIFDVAANSIQKQFIILSSCPWGSVYQRMHHIARSLAKFGQDVNYITPTIDVKMEAKHIGVSELLKYSFENMKVVDKVKIFSPISINNGETMSLNNYLDLIQKILDLNKENGKSVIISYMPYQVEIIKSLKGKFTHIYECVDDHSDLEYAFWGSKRDILWEQELMDICDSITTTSTSLFLQRTSIEKRNNVFLSKNAVNESDFMTDNLQIPNDLKDIPEPRIVYAGVVYKRFDEGLFYDVVESNPDKSFVIIGPVEEGMLQKKCKNLYLLGPKKHSELKDYFRHMQIGIVPYIDSADMDIACDSIKQYEYIACGLPVITTFMPESAIDKIYIYLANSKEQFNNAIKECLSMKIDNHIKTRFLSENSWNARAALLCKLADNCIGKEESIKMLKQVGEKLNKLRQKYNSPIFKMLYAIYVNSYDGKEFEILSKELYEDGRNKYIEKYYLLALLNNNDIDNFIKVASNSTNIRTELKKELLFSYRNGSIDNTKVIACFCINDVKKALLYINNLKDRSIQNIYTLYLRHILGESIKKDLKYINSIKNGKSSLLKYLKELNRSKSENQIDTNNIKVLLVDIFDNIHTKQLIDKLNSNNMQINGFCSRNNGMKETLPVFSFKEVVSMQSQQKIKLIVPYNNDYIKQVRILAETGVSECYIAVFLDSNVELVYIEPSVMSRVKTKKYNKTVTFSKFNAADSNIHALIKYIPEEYKNKYNINVIYGKDVWSIKNIVLVPLISNVTVSGFGTFLYNYPKLTYNIEVGHNGIPLKACGNMDKKFKSSGGNQELYEKCDCICVTSHLHMVINASSYFIPENKYEITGLPRNDMLMTFDSRVNLEKLLKVKLNNKKIIFNMPTFHKFDDMNRIEGALGLDDSIKIYNFNYDEFNRFLENNNLICISKVHHGEEATVNKKSKNRKYSSLFFINNDDLEKANIDLYEILGAGDVLITDYSSVYDDFLYMNKPIIFVNTDIEEYKNERGLSLEPYEFWTAGPKVQDQERLQQEILKCITDKNYYKEERERLQPVFFKDMDNNAIKRTWDVIDRAFGKIVKE